MYCPVRKLTRHVLCLFVMLGFVQKLFHNVLSMSLFLSHLCNKLIYDLYEVKYGTSFLTSDHKCFAVAFQELRLKGLFAHLKKY